MYTSVFDIREYGAVGDGATVNTAAIQRAIDACAAAGGGTVSVSQGVFVTGTLFMRSFVELRIEANATLKASASTDDFPDFPCEEWNVRAAPRGVAKCLIYFGNLRNAALTGLGTIHCCGSAYCDPVKNDAGEIVRYERNTLLVPARMVFIMGCTNVKVEDVTMLEMAGGWGYWVNNSQYITFLHAKLYCNPLYPNADGIHINCSSDVLIDSCTVHSGDDSIIIRANTNTLSENRVCERVVVKGCTLSSHCQAVRIAWRNDGTIRNCTVADTVVTRSRHGIVIDLPDHSSPTDVGTHETVVENIHISNVILDEVAQLPIRITVHPENLYGAIRNIRFSGITSSSGCFPVVKGRSDAVISEIYFENCKFTVRTPSGYAKWDVPFFSSVRGLHLTSTTFDVLDEPRTANPYIEREEAFPQATR